MPKRRVTIGLSEGHYERYKAAAETLDVSLTAWILFAVGSYYGRWKDPEEMRRGKAGGKSPRETAKTEGMWCVDCDLPASECKYESVHNPNGWSRYSPSA